jgi:hypothetical protein
MITPISVIDGTVVISNANTAVRPRYRIGALERGPVNSSDNDAVNGIDVSAEKTKEP